jgi:large subunit ribosomal protein L9
MKVILLQTVPKVGKESTVVNVADGFARNFLFPRGLAIVADKNQVTALNRRLERQAEKQADLKKDAEALKAKIEGSVLRIAGQVGAVEGKLFGAITAQNVADAIKAQLGVSLERKQIGIVDAFKKLGTFPVVLDLHREVDANISVVVFDPKAPVEPEPTTEESEG